MNPDDLAEATALFIEAHRRYQEVLEQRLAQTEAQLAGMRDDAKTTTYWGIE